MLHLMCKAALVSNIWHIAGVWTACRGAGHLDTASAVQAESSKVVCVMEQASCRAIVVEFTM